MNRMKVSEIITTINSLCCIAILLGIFLPFAKLEIWGYDIASISIFKFLTDSDIKELISYTDQSTNLTMTVIVFAAAFIASFAAGVNFSSNVNLTPAIIMIIAALTGKYMVTELTDEVFQFDVIRKLVGSSLLTWGYKIMLWDSFAAFAVNFYLTYIAASQSALAENINRLVGLRSVKCEHCGKIHIGSGDWCTGCGHKLPEKSSQSQSKAWICSKCGNKNEGLFCQNCGSSKPNTVDNNIQNVRKTWICSKCNNENAESSRFCENCGNSKS